MRALRTVFVLLAIAGGSLVATSGAVADDNAAIVFKDIGCSGGLPGVGAFSITGNGVVTSSGNANFCHGEVATAPSETLHFNDIRCAGPGGVGTADIVVTKSGRITLICQVHPS